MPARRGLRVSAGNSAPPAVRAARSDRPRGVVVRCAQVLFFIGLAYLWLLVSDPSGKSMNSLSLRLWAGLAAAGKGAAAEERGKFLLNSGLNWAEAEEPGMEDGAGEVEWTEKRVHQALQAGRVGPKGMLYPYRRDAMRTDEKYFDGPLAIQSLPGGPQPQAHGGGDKGILAHTPAAKCPAQHKQARTSDRDHCQHRGSRPTDHRAQCLPHEYSSD